MDNKKTVQLITHCWAAKLPQYAAMLRYHLAAADLHPPAQCYVSYVVCCAHGDTATARVLADYPHVGRCVQTVAEIGRRCIGRDQCAITSAADYVVFTDVDYVWHGAALDALVSLRWPPGAAMVYPRAIQIARDHATGDEIWQRADKCPDIDPREFVVKTYNRAIGGVQIVRGDFARIHGYLNNDPRWQAPRTDGQPFKDFRDDIAYRRFCLGRGEVAAVDLPKIFRIRHSKTTYQ